jgi:uroporphyrinogen-III synthase
VRISGLGGPLFYLTGKHQSGDLAKALAPLGVMVATSKIYDMVAADALAPEVMTQLEAGEIAAVLIYSRRTAEIFAHLAAGLSAERKRALAMLCISEQAAEPLLEARFSRISLADWPDEDAMMALALAFAREQIGP